jgi:caffeoyl-CoA O-methyltransferase
MADGKFTALNSRLYDYVVTHGHNDDAVLKELAEETASKLGRISGMQISPEQGTLMTILARVIGARSAIEVGTFTGYSAICVARALPSDGHLLCCDVSEEWTAIARDAWKQAGLDDRIELRLAPAAETLKALPQDEPIDFAFIDADKSSYWTYYSELLPRLRTGGVIAVDNVLWSGRVADTETGDRDTEALKEFNERVVADERVDVVMLPVGDGVTLACKR